MPSASPVKALRAVSSHAAVRALAKSVLINMIAPAVIYRLATPHFATTSLVPLALSGVPPILWLAYSLLKLRAIDFLGLFAAENIVVSLAALVLAHTEQQALIGRSLQNVILAGLFLASLATTKPFVLQMARQVSTGNDPAKRDAFDAEATRPGALKTYQELTLGWVFALLIKAAGSYELGAHLPADRYLLVSPLWDLITDSLLLAWTLFYRKSKLGAAPVEEATPARSPAAAP